MNPIHLRSFGLLVLAAGLLSRPAQAFDPVGPPPEKTLEWTVNTVRPSIQFLNAGLEEACEFIMGTGSIPSSYSLKIDYSQIKVPQGWTISMDEKNITVIKAVAMIAEKCNADLLVKPGVIILVPRQKP